MRADRITVALARSRFSVGAPVVRPSYGAERRLCTLKRGPVRDSQARKPINARSDTISRSKEAFARRRCVIPTPVYYKWRDDPDGKTPFAVARVDGDPVAFGGIWEKWRSPEGERLQTFATITTDANDLLAPIQDRIAEQTEWPV
jgi:putative SOS response-associated peptidase YedK